MSIGIACLLSDDPAKACALAAQLDTINAERRVVQQQMIDEAETLVSTITLDGDDLPAALRSEEHTSELQSLMRISYAVFCLKTKTHHTNPLSATYSISYQHSMRCTHINS